MPKENGKVRSEYLLAALMCIAVAFFLTILIVSNSCNVDSPEEDASAVTSSIPSEPSETPESSAPSEQGNPVKTETVSVTDLTGASDSTARVAEGLLVLAPGAEGNASGGELVNIYEFNAAGHPYGYSGTKLELREDALKALNAMVTAFNTAQGGKTELVVHMAYLGEKSSDVSEAVAENLATGCAVYFTIHPWKTGDDYLGMGKYLWLADNCYNYGYILRYPALKTDSTHQEENSHLYRFVGYEHAAYMGQYHLSLEEYLDTLRTYTSVDSPLQIACTDVSGRERNCVVYYVPVSGEGTDKLPVRSDATEVTYTGDGSGGIIVTCYID